MILTELARQLGQTRSRSHLLIDAAPGLAAWPANRPRGRAFLGVDPLSARPTLASARTGARVGADASGVFWYESPIVVGVHGGVRSVLRARPLQP